MIPEALPDDVGRPRQACILGLGRSGLGAARLLLSEGTRVRALDLAPDPLCLARWNRLATARRELITGPHPLAALDGCDLLVRSPGIPVDAPIVAAARRRAIPIISEIQLAAQRAPGPLLAVTGTNGKSTTTAWAAHLLRRAGHAAIACGNIGHAFSEAVLDEPGGTIFVVEISSFQLEDSPAFHPRAAAILNITPDHIGRHGGFEAYRMAKWQITANQDEANWLILGPGIVPPESWPVRARIASFALRDPGGEHALYVQQGDLIWRAGGRSRTLLPARELALSGPHNLFNAMAAFALTHGMLSEPEALARGLRDFTGLPHRLELVADADGVRWINDSKATNVDSLRVALESFSDPIILIAGGRDKEGAFEELTLLAGQHVRCLIAIGEAAQRIRRAWPEVSSETAPDLAAAIERAADVVGSPGVVLLSPGCASFDMFKDYAERGDRFRDLVRAHLGLVTKGER